MCFAVRASDQQRRDNTLVLVMLFIICVDAAFQLSADFERHKDDSSANGRRCRVYDRTTAQLVDKRGDEVVVGDVLKLCNGESVPADLRS